MSTRQQVDVVVADDNEESADLMAMLIELQGYTAVATYGGAGCIEAITRHRPRLVVTDMSMPSITGVDVLCAARRMDTDYYPIVVSMTGWNDLAQQVPDEVRGFDSHFTKPVSYESIKMMLEFLNTRKP